jgi:hypothetical protein
MKVSFLSSIVKVNMATDCHLSCQPIGQSTTTSTLDYIQPVQTLSSPSNTNAIPSSLATIGDHEEEDDCLPTYAAYWPKKPHTPQSLKYDMSLIPPPAYSVSLKDLDHDALIKRLYSIKYTSSPPDNSATTPAAPPPKVGVAPSRLKCLSEDNIVTHFHHLDFCLPPIHPCNTPNLSKTKPTYTLEELHCLTGCC